MKLPRPRLPRGLAQAAADRFHDLRYLLADVLFVLARFPRAVASGVGRFWTSLPVVARRRLAAALGAVALFLVMASLVVPNLPCAFPGGDECPPDDDAIELAPAGALAYMHANLDAETDQARLATEVVGRMPEVGRQAIPQLVGLLGPATGSLDAIGEPWFGGEIAGVVIGGDRRPEQVQLLETSDPDAARDYAESLGAGGEGVEAEVVGGFLALGSRQGVRAIARVAEGEEEAGTLADDATATRALDELPDHRVFEAYLSREGIQEFVASAESPLSTLEPLIGSTSSLGAALSVSAGEEGLSIATRSLADPERSEAEPGFFAAFEEFSPELPAELPANALAYLGLGRPQDTVEALLDQATVSAPGIAAGVTDLLERLRGSAGVDLQRDLLEALGGEAAVAVVPRQGGGGEGAAVPYLQFLADDVDEEGARQALARLQGPIAGELDPQLGAPDFSQRRIGDVEAQVLRLSPVAQIVYATSDGKLVLANDEAAVRRLGGADDGGLADADRFEETMDGLPDEPALHAYLDLRGLLELAERSGLAEDTAYAAFAPDLRRLASLGLTVTREDGTLAADARLLID